MKNAKQLVLIEQDPIFQRWKNMNLYIDQEVSKNYSIFSKVKERYLKLGEETFFRIGFSLYSWYLMDDDLFKTLNNNAKDPIVKEWDHHKLYLDSSIFSDAKKFNFLKEKYQTSKIKNWILDSKILNWMELKNAFHTPDQKIDFSGLSSDNLKNSLDIT